MYGFGAEVPDCVPENAEDTNEIISNFFALNGNIYDPEVKGIRGALRAYKNAVNRCQLGQCDVKMSEVLKNINDYCRKQEDEMKSSQKEIQRYNILLILTNEEVSNRSDMTKSNIKTIAH